MRAVFIFLLMLSLQLFGASTYELVGCHDDNSILVKSEPSFLYQSKTLSVQEAYKAYMRGEFKNMSSADNGFSLGDRVYWMAIEIENLSNEAIYLQIKNPAIKSVEFFSYRNNMQLPSANSDLSEAGNLYFEHQLLQGETPTLYFVRIESKRLAGTTVQLGSEFDLEYGKLYEKLFLSIVGGCMLGLFLYNLTLYRFTAQKVYLTFSAYLFFFFVYLSGINDSLVDFLQDYSPTWYIIRPISAQAYHAALIFFTLYLFDIEKLSRRLFKASLVIGGAIFLLFLSFYMSSDWAVLGHAASLVSYIFCIFLAIFAQSRGQQVSKLYLLAIVVYAAFALLFSASLIGLLPFSNTLLYGVYAGAVWQMVLLSFMLAYKVKLLQVELDRAIVKNEVDSNMLYTRSRYASLGEMIGNIAHQWKQPLNAIGAIQTALQASLMYQGEISKEKLLKSVNTSFEILKHLSETMDTFYEFLNKKTGESFSVARQLEAIRKITEYTFENSQIKLVYDIRVNPEIQGSANELLHVLLNIILNAKDAFDKVDVEQPQITVTVDENDEGCVITIADNAGGIMLEPKLIFEMYASTKEGGSGLGLFMAKNIIEHKFGGTIRAMNQDGGAVFVIEIPNERSSEIFRSIEDENSSFKYIKNLTDKVIELQQHEKALKKWADTFSRVSLGIVIYDVTECKIELINPAFAKMHGYTEEELLGKSIGTICICECDGKSCEHCDAYGVEGFHSLEWTNVRKDGTTFEVQLDVNEVKDANGNTTHLIAYTKDLTEQKEIYEQLRLKTFALDHITEEVYLVDEDAKIVYVNEEACHKLGYSKEELLSMRVADVDPDWPEELWHSAFKNSIKEQKSIHTEVRHKKKDGTLFPTEISLHYLDYKGKSYYLGICRDLTKIKQMQSQLIESLKHSYLVDG